MDNKLLPEQQERIEGEAADWLLTMNEGSLSDDTLSQWRQWIDASPHHRDCYEKMLQLWSLADELPSTAQNSTASAESKPAEVVPIRRNKSRWLWQGAAAAAVLVLAISVLMPTKQPLPFTSIGMISGLQTTTGQHASYTMPDGSVIEMGADSKVELAYSDTERRIVLISGEALFDVAKNPDKPFIVAAGSGQYRALGTQFNVELTKNDSTLTVVEGVVQARLQDSEDGYDGSNYPRLVAGEAVTVSADGTIGDVHQVDASAMVAWQKGQLIFVDQPFQDVFERLNRYRETPVVVAKELKQLRYTGSVHRDNMPAMLSLLPEIFPVRVVSKPEAVYLMPKS